jgi:hypothetical protein
MKSLIAPLRDQLGNCGTGLRATAAAKRREEQASRHCANVSFGRD